MLRDLVEELRGLVEAKKKPAPAPAPAPAQPEELITKTLRFYECEHQGDADSYAQDLAACGAQIVDTHVNYDEEVCTIKFTVPKSQWSEFQTKFKKTDAYGYLD